MGSFPAGRSPSSHGHRGLDPLLKQLGDRLRRRTGRARRHPPRRGRGARGQRSTRREIRSSSRFPRNAAVGAAVTAQRGLAEHAWPDGGEVRVRMGLHTGEPAVGEERYVGLGVHRAARIGAVAHGGQVLLSGATPGTGRGRGRGRDCPRTGAVPAEGHRRPEPLYQLDIDGLQTDFPPVRAREPSRHARSAERLFVLAAG